MSEPEVRITRRRWRRTFIGVLLVLAALMAVPGYLMSGRPINAPTWAEERIAQQASNAIPDASVSFGDAEVYLADHMHPQIRLLDLVITDDDGREIIRFAEAEGALWLDALTRGQAELKEITLTGVFASLARGSDGGYSVTTQDAISGPSQEAGNFAELVRAIDGVFETPSLSRLTSATLESLTLRYEDARSGRAWTIDGARAAVTREGDALNIRADLALLSGGQGVATVAADYSGTIGETEAQFGVQIEDIAAADIAAQGPAFVWLEPLRAPISGSVRGSVTEDGTLGPLNATLALGEGVLQPNDITRPIPFQSARTYFTYHPDEQALEFSEVSIASDWVTTQIEGQAILGPEGEDLVGQFGVSKLSFDPANLYGEMQSVESAAIDFRINYDPFSVELGQFYLRDQGQVLHAFGEIAAQEDGWRYAIDAQMDSLAPDRLMALWPKGLATKTRTWISENVLAGTLNDIDFVLRGAPVVRPDLYFSFDYQDARVRYARTLPPLEEAMGHATMFGNRLVIAVDDGHVDMGEAGQISADGSTFIVPDITVRDGAPGVVRLNVEGSVPAALAYLNTPPLSVMDKANLPLDLATGQIAAEGSIRLPLRRGAPPEEILWDARGVMRDVTSTQLVKGFTLQADALTLDATQKRVSIGGPGTLSGVPFNATWSQRLRSEDPGRVVGTVALSEQAAETFNLGLPPGSLSGSARGNIDVSLPRGAAPRLTLTTDLAGLGAAIPAIGWRLPQSSRGDLRVEAQLGTAPRVDLISLNAPGLSARGAVSLRSGGGLNRAEFSRVQAGSWLDAPVTFIGRGAGAPPDVRVNSGRIDLRTANFQSNGGAGRSAGPLTLNLDTLQIADTIAMSDFAGTFNVSGGLDGRFTGRVNGGAAVEGRVLPQNGASAVRITSEDAGGVFSSAGLLKQARGGFMDLTLLPVGQAGAFDGTLIVNDTRVKNAPVMADLLSALSIVGLLEQLSGQGILFTEVDATFRLTPGQVILRSASAVGPSMGISMDGTYTNANRALNMQGVISPIYLINSIGSFLTRKGEGLIGFSYRLGGTAGDPQIVVNPLSAFTPGMFREIFRTPPPDLPELQPRRQFIIPQEFEEEQRRSRRSRSETQVQQDNPGEDR